VSETAVSVTFRYLQHFAKGHGKSFAAGGAKLLNHYDGLTNTYLGAILPAEFNWRKNHEVGSDLLAYYDRCSNNAFGRVRRRRSMRSVKDRLSYFGGGRALQVEVGWVFPLLSRAVVQTGSVFFHQRLKTALLEKRAVFLFIYF